MRLFYSDTNFSGDGFGGYLRSYVGWVWAATFLIFLFLFLMLFLFISREMMFAVVAATTTGALLLALAGRLFKLETRQVGGRLTELALLSNTVVMLRRDGCRTVFLFAHYRDDEATLYSSFMPPEPAAEEDFDPGMYRDLLEGSLVP
jgi:hypothetical protein